MLDRYLRDGETIESRIDELLTDARATGARNLDLVQARLTEAHVLTALIPAATVELGPAEYVMNGYHPASPAEVGESLGEPVYTADDIAKALDGVFDGGSAPTVLRAALLALLVDGLAPVDKVGIEDTALLDPLADGTTPRLPEEEHSRSYIDLGADLDVEMPEHDADVRVRPEMEDDEDFPEFAPPEADPLEATITKPKKKGGKKTAAQRAAEEAGA